MTARILLIDKDTVTIERVRPALEREGYRVSEARPGLDAIRMTLSGDLGLVILGMEVDEEDWNFCHRLLTFLDIPLLLLLGSDDDLDRVRALDLGADDCMFKPALLVELIARVRALLRRNSGAIPRKHTSFFVDDNLAIDLTRREVRLDGEPVAMTPTEFRLLACFVRHVGEVLSHDRLATQVWGPSQARGRDTIKQYVHHLRQKLEPDPSQPRRLVTRWGEGYMFQPVTGEVVRPPVSTAESGSG